MIVRALLVAVLLAMPPPAIAVAPGDIAPPFALASAQGTPLALESLRGKVVYVDFWASWCGPCKRSFPWMAEMQRRYAAQGFTVVAVNVDKKRADADRFLAVMPATFPVVFDDAGRTPAAWHVKGMPSSYLVDAGGRVLHVESGFREERKDDVEAKIRAALAAR